MNGEGWGIVLEWLQKSGVCFHFILMRVKFGFRSQHIKLAYLNHGEPMLHLMATTRFMLSSFKTHWASSWHWLFGCKLYSILQTHTIFVDDYELHIYIWYCMTVRWCAWLGLVGIEQNQLWLRASADFHTIVVQGRKAITPALISNYWFESQNKT